MNHLASVFKNKLLEKTAWTFGVVFLAGALILLVNQTIVDIANEEKKLKIGNAEFKVEVSDNQQERFLGLSGRKNICDECGMLFIFPQKGNYQFVMREMNFPLDFIWLDSQSKTVVGIVENVSPDLKEIISPSVDFDMALEAPGGICKRYGIKEGDSFSFD